MSVYYAKLPTSRGTRVLSLEPLPDIVDPSHAPSGHEAVHCDWSVISVDEPEPYYALSYVWGNPNIKEYHLICNGRLMKITYKIWAAKAVWSKYPSRRLRVDAICINQDDIPERKQQVTMMGNIYSRAERVAIWVGEATVHSDDFFKLVERVQAGGKLTIGECPRPPTNDIDRSQGSDRDFMNHLLDCAADIVNRSWFIRAWTFQEIRLTRQATISCGLHVADIGLFLRTVTDINGTSERRDLCSGMMVIIPFSAPDSSFKLLYRFPALKQPRAATGPRDKVYSLLSLLPRRCIRLHETRL
ncbi:hypothetical protein PLEOSDRAFT_159377 [Pleurotus ostreatus PC15]|uniref:Heterokaryon incompatibility domain-containing protein n=1 Tax=Pleurotus ostreatus (strain PC15) TaxID=1137138 RepID=A0A067NFS1_PLEO1|nr:hypothetical protein PLEOSDRAFT_159377 [Pleurotus ostreatus PC15]